MSFVSALSTSTLPVVAAQDEEDNEREPQSQKDSPSRGPISGREGGRTAEGEVVCDQSNQIHQVENVHEMSSKLSSLAFLPPRRDSIETIESCTRPRPDRPARRSRPSVRPSIDISSC